MNWVEHEYNWLEWNGNRDENMKKVRAQVMEILPPSLYGKLGAQLAKAILEVVENGRNKI
ncbi:MAG: hypothetical protein AB1485_01560 [Candidatus Thermoplasmatota archaeon]